MAVEKSPEPLVLNSTQFPNILLDAILPLCSPAVWKLLCVIVRQTYGWHKNFDNISLSQLEKKTGLSDRGIRNSIETLKSAGLLIRGKANEHGWSYKIDVNCDLDHAGFVLAGVELSTRGVELSTRDGWNSVPLGVELSTRTKETTKETVSKETLPPEKNDASLEFDRYSAAKILGEMVGMGYSGYNLHTLVSAIDQGKRRWPDIRNEEIAVKVHSIWLEYIEQTTHAKVSLKTFLDTVGRYVDNDDWRSKPKGSGFVVDAQGGHFEGTVYVTKEGRRLPGYKPNITEVKK